MVGSPVPAGWVPITAALKNLRDQGLATNQNQRGYWTFKAKEASVEELQDFNEIREVYEKEIIKDLIESADRLQTRANSQRVKKIAEVVNRCHERLQKLIASCEIIEEVERTTKPQPSPDLPMNLTKGD